MGNNRKNAWHKIYRHIEFSAVSFAFFMSDNESSALY